MYFSNRTLSSDKNYAKRKEKKESQGTGGRWHRKGFHMAEL